MKCIFINVNIFNMDEYVVFLFFFVFLLFYIFWIMLRSMFNMVYKLCIYIEMFLINRYIILRFGEKFFFFILVVSFFSLFLIFLLFLFSFIFIIIF